MKVYTCYDCHKEFSRGRGRPPKLPLCEECKQYGEFRKAEVKEYLSEKKMDFDKPKRAPTPKKVGITIKQISAVLEDEPSVKKPRRSSLAPEEVAEALLPESPPFKPLHGASGSAVTRPCPECGWAYADGGYCSDCGWEQPIHRLPYGTATGKTRK